MREQLDRLAYKLGRSPGGPAVTALLGSEARPDLWVFVVGCYNSGTTLVADILREHPAIGGPSREGAYLTDRLSHPERLGWKRMWHACLDDLRQPPESLSPADIRRIRRQWGFWSDRSRPVLLEKSIANTYRIPAMAAHFRPAAFIHVVRHGAAAAEGIRRKAAPEGVGDPAWNGRYPLELCARQWTASLDAVDAAAPALERFLEVRYEDFVADPDAQGRVVTDFLGLDPFPGTVQEERKVHGEVSGIKDMNASSLARLDEAEKALLRDIQGAHLAARGYALD